MNVAFELTVDTHIPSLLICGTVFVIHCSYIFRSRDLVIFRELQIAQMYTTHFASSHVNDNNVCTYWYLSTKDVNIFVAVYN